MTNPRVHFPNQNRSDLVETTDQVCKKCGVERLNTVLIPPESVKSLSLEPTVPYYVYN